MPFQMLYYYIFRLNDNNEKKRYSCKLIISLRANFEIEMICLGFNAILSICRYKMLPGPRSQSTRKDL